MTFEILTEVSAKYYNIDKTESVEIIIPSVVNNGRKVKTLGIWCSGGADSSALLYLLCKEVIRNNLDVKIQPMSVRRQRPWNPIKATHVINKITEILNFRNIVLTNFHGKCNFNVPFSNGKLVVDNRKWIQETRSLSGKSDVDLKVQRYL